MIFQNLKIKKLLEYYKDIWALNYAFSNLHWDYQTYMPRGAANERGEAFARLKALIQKFFLDEKFKKMLEEAEGVEDLNDYEKGVVRVLRREMDRFAKIPRELLMEEAKVTAEAQVVWEKAKKESKFELFKPYLEKIVDIERRKAEYLGYEDNPYNALLDLFEEGWTVKDVEKMFSSVKDRLVKIYAKIRESMPEKHPLEGETYDKDLLHRLNMFIAKRLGYDFRYGRLDISPHPFTINIGAYDVRITTRYEGRDFRRSLLAVVHEYGHALYEMQIDKRLAGTPLGTGVSLGIHESQSRFWENIIGRSREFVKRFYEVFAAFLPFVEKYSIQDLYIYFNLVRPEYIRVEADEVQYVLHIVLRYEIEKGLIEGSLEVADVPEVWNEKMEKYVGAKPPTDALGCLQDIHWTIGSIGYFPTYALGTLLSAQIAHKIEDQLGSISDLIARGDYKLIREWLKEKIHKYGSTYPPKELLKKSLGEEANPEYFLKYIESKFKDFL